MNYDAICSEECLAIQKRYKFMYFARKDDYEGNKQPSQCSVVQLPSMRRRSCCLRPPPEGCVHLTQTSCLPLNPPLSTRGLHQQHYNKTHDQGDSTVTCSRGNALHKWLVQHADSLSGSTGGCNTREMYSFILYMKEGHFTLMPTPPMRQQQRGGRGRGAHGSRKVKPD